MSVRFCPACGVDLLLYPHGGACTRKDIPRYGGVRPEERFRNAAEMERAIEAEYKRVAHARLEPRPCCKFFGVGNTLYKGIYLPSKDEYVAHGYPADRYEAAMAQWKRGIDETGRP